MSREKSSNEISRTLRQADPPRSGLVQRLGDEPRALFASVSIALLGSAPLCRSVGKVHLHDFFKELATYLLDLTHARSALAASSDKALFRRFVSDLY